MSIEHKVNFGYTGGVQTFTAPYTGLYQLEVWGAEGGRNLNNANYISGKGGYSKGNIYLVANQQIQVYIGGKGVDSNNKADSAPGTNILGGFNGGGRGTNGGAGGGGATDIRVDGSALGHRVIVAGGAGGVGNGNGSSPGGHGGGLTGGTGSGSGTGAGGTQSSGYTLGTGGNWNNTNDCGGGGYYGGYGGSTSNTSGGGGSGYVGGVLDGQTIPGDQTIPNTSGGTELGHQGHGYAIITLAIYGDVAVKNVTLDKDIIFHGDEIEVSWDITENDFDVVYDIQVDIGSGWATLISSVIKDIKSYTYKIPFNKKNYESACFRIRSRLSNSSYAEEWVVSPIFTIKTYGFLVKVEGLLYTYRDNNWVEIVDAESKETFLTHGMPDLDHIPESKWSELEGDISLTTFTNLKDIPVVDVTSPSYRPIYLLNEKLSVSDLIIRSYVASKSPMTLHKRAVPKRQLIFPTGDINLYSPTVPEAVVGFNLTANEGANTTMRIMFSIDKGDTYVSWDGSQWNEYTDVINDEATEEIVQQHGMTIDVLNALTKDQLGEIFDYEPKNRTVRFVYLYDMNYVSDNLQSGELRISMDMHGSWRQAKDSDFTYGYPTNTELHVQLFASGSYKINGLLYGDELVIPEGV